MKNFFALLVCFGALAFAYFQFPQIQKLIYYSPCDTPIHYKIGTVDSRFNLSQAELKSDIASAGKIWSDAEGKPLFQFDPQGELTVSMVYDERQYLSSTLDQLGNSVDKLSSTVNTLEGTLSSKQKNLNQDIASFQQDVNSFKQKLTIYNEEVKYWNDKGGAPADEYAKLQQTQKDLESQQQVLSQEQTKIQSETKNYNGDVDALNKTIGDYNTQVSSLKDTASSFNQTIQLHPEEGLYNGPKDTIDIYYNISHAELVHTLAHEFGHALGMDHNQNKNSIMYPYTTKALTPSPDDLASLNSVCQKQTALNLLWNRLASYKLGN